MDRVQHNGTVALVEDDPGIRILVTDLLKHEGYRVLAYGAAEEFYQADVTASLDCLILDVMLPGEDGLSICHKLRVLSPRLPILIVTARRDELDRIIALELGADDYLAKPFNSRELLARLRSILRRTRDVAKVEASGGDTFRFSGWSLTIASRELTSPSGNAVPLTAGEFDLLHALVTHPQRVVTRDQLLDWTRGRAATPFDRVIDVQVSRLRRRLGDDPRDPAMIRTIRGDGYLFAPTVMRC